MLSPESLIQPHGPIDPSFFPDDAPPPEVGAGSLHARLTAYIERGYEAAPGQDVPAKNWALHLAFDDAHSLMAARPAAETYFTGMGGHSYIAEQIKTFARKSAEYLTSYHESLTDYSVSMRSDPVSRLTENRFDW